MSTKTETRARWREENRERIRAYDRARYQERSAAEKARVAEWRRQNPERAKAIGAAWREKNRQAIRDAARAKRAASPGDARRRRALGFDGPAFRALFAKQGACCAVCRVTEAAKWNLDHSHATGIARGVLCNKCNLSLGLLSDDPVRLRAAADYLERHAQLHALL